MEPGGRGAVRLYRRGGAWAVRCAAPRSRTALGSDDQAVRRGHGHRGAVGRGVPHPAQGRQLSLGGVPQHAAAGRPRRLLRSWPGHRQVTASGGRAGRCPVHPAGFSVAHRAGDPRYRSAVCGRQPRSGADARHSRGRSSGSALPRDHDLGEVRGPGGRHAAGPRDRGSPGRRVHHRRPHPRRPIRARLVDLAVPAGRPPGTCSRAWPTWW